VDKLDGVQRSAVRMIMAFANRTYRKSRKELRLFSLEKRNSEERQCNSLQRHKRRKRIIFSLQPICNEPKLEQRITGLNMRKNFL